MFSRFWNNGNCILPEIYHFWVQNVKLGQIQPRQFNGLKKMRLEPKFEVSISKNEKNGAIICFPDFGIMVPAFYLKYTVFGFKM